MCNLNNYEIEQSEIDEKAEELQKNFTYDGYQVVRRELFAHQREPAVVIRRESITFNTACISGLEDAVYVQILVNPENKRMVVRKCDENDKDALRWCIEKPDKRKSRKVTSKIFSAKIYDLMEWNTDCRYKILGHKISYEDEQIYIFDLIETEIYIDIKKVKQLKTDEQVNQSQDNANLLQATPTRKPFYPEDWKDSFGLPIDEHKKALQMTIIEGYTTFDS